jgi:acyl-homoserine lactone acylase PvdQ
MGQLFVYQGFNEKCGWMHTSSYTDIADTYLEKIQKKGNTWVYLYEGKERPVKIKKVKIGVLKNGKIENKNFDVMYTHHGHVMAKRNGQWISMKANNRSMTGLIQSWQRTKAKSFAEYKKRWICWQIPPITPFMPMRKEILLIGMVTICQFVTTNTTGQNQWMALLQLPNGKVCTQ